MDKTYNDIGNIAVTPAGTGNPYQSGVNIMGKERSEALRKLLVDGSDTAHDFWLCHPSMGAKRLHTAEEANVDPDVIAYYWGPKGIRSSARVVSKKAVVAEEK